MITKMKLKEWEHKREVYLKTFTDPEASEEDRDYAYIILENLFKLREHGFVEEE